MIGLSSVQYMKNVYLNVIIVTLLSLAVPGLLSKYMEESFISFVVLSLVAIVCTLIVEFCVGCNGKERTFIMGKVNSIVQKIKK